MPQIGGKNAKKSSKTKSKSSSTSKRHFTVVIGTKEHGLYCSSSPSSAARKAVSKLCGKEKGKKVEFCLREITQGSKKKTYGPYLGHIEKLAKPIELKGRIIERKPVALLKPKNSAKKGGMRGGGINEIIISLGNCGRSRIFGVWKLGCITLIHEETKVVLYYNEVTKNLEVRYFENRNNNVYSNKLIYTFQDFDMDKFKTIIMRLINSTDTNFTNDDLIGLIKRIDNNSCDNLHCSMVINFLNKLLQKGEQTKKKPINILSQRAEILSRKMKNQQERNMRITLEFERQAEQARLIKARERELNNIEYRRRLLESLPPATTENQ